MRNKPKLSAIPALLIIKNPCPERPPPKQPKSLLAKILKAISVPLKYYELLIKYTTEGRARRSLSLLGVQR
jgi:hypothetical protein